MSEGSTIYQHRPISRKVILVAFLAIVLFMGLNAFSRRNLYLVMQKCPHCDVVDMYGVTRHDPSGVSHTETLYCPSCYKNFRVIVYYDGEVTVVRPTS